MHALTYSAAAGTYILTGSADRSIRLYNPQPSNNHNTTSISSNNITTSKKAAATATTAIPEGRLIQTYAAHGYEVLSLCISSSNAKFASCGGDRLVFLWDVSTAQTIRRFGGSGGAGAAQGGHTARINCVTFGGALFSSSSDNNHNDGGGDESLLISGSLDASVRIWDARAHNGAHKPVQTLSEARDSVTSVACPGRGG